MNDECKLHQINKIVDKLLELEKPNSKERLELLEGRQRVVESGYDVTDSQLVGHYMGVIRHIKEILKA